MHPILFRLGPLAITSYGVSLALACLLVAWLAQRLAERAPRELYALHGVEVLDWVGWTMIGGLVGGRLVYVALNWELYRAAPWTIVALWEGGLVWYGGFVGGLFFGTRYCLSRGCGWRRPLDQVIPFVALGHAIGRIGCFLNGCCYGHPTRAWCGVLFPGHTERVLPTQLFESLGLLVLYVWLRRRQRPSVLIHPGAVFGSYLVGYGLLRWTIERWRDNPLFAGTGWTFSQWVSAVAVIAGLVIAQSAQKEHRDHR